MLHSGVDGSTVGWRGHGTSETGIFVDGLF